MYGYKCEYCEGIVREKLLKQEAFKHKKGFVILEDVLIGVCDQCGNRYFSSEILKTVDAVAAGKKLPEKMQPVPVARAS